MENNDLTFWKNYQTGMEWIKGNTINSVPIVMKEEEEGEEDLEFLIDDELLDFYRFSKEHKANRSKRNRMNCIKN
jgi:hypothetical protein